MHVTVLFAPGTDPRSPHLAMAALAAYLREAGVRTTLRDVDLESFLWSIAPPRVTDAVNTCRRLYDQRDAGDRAHLRALLDESDSLLQHIGSAVATLRDPAAFYDSLAHHAARRWIRVALETVCAASDGLVDYSIEPPHYDVRDTDMMRLADLARATGDGRANLFEDFFRSSVIADLDRDRPDVVAVSILNFQQIIPGLTLARRLKDRGHFVVIGGTVYTKFVGELLQRPDFFRLFCDGVIAYEGESALLELVQQVNGGRDFSRVPNYLYLDQSGRVTFTRYLVEDVNALPTPDYDGLPLGDYLSPVPVLPILTGKGCYFNRCKFCDIPYINHISKKAYRVRHPERIAADVATLHQRHRTRFFEITDEALAPKLLLRLADALDDYPRLRPRFVGYARLEPGFTREVCRRVYDMGVRKLFFGLESGSQATLDHMDKGIRVSDASTVLRNCSDVGIGFHLFSIIGFPQETEERARETLAFFLNNAGLIDQPRNTFDIHPFSLDLRTQYYEQSTQFGIELQIADRDSSPDFPVSASGWRNTAGLDQGTVGQLLAEFHDTLRRTYRTYHQYPLNIWPGYEEYAVLYGDHYEQQPFPYRISLPSREDHTPVRLVWTENASFTSVDADFIVSGPLGAARVGSNALALLARPREPMSVDHLLTSLAAAFGGDHEHVAAHLRTVIDWLLGTGALQLVTA